MKAHLRWMAWYGLAAAALVVCPLLMLSFQKSPGALEATYGRGILHVTIPCQTPRAGAGMLTVEVLDPEDHAVSHVERRVDADPKGVWRVDLKFEQAPALEDLVWHRLRVRFEYGDTHEAAVQNIETISAILRLPVLHIVGQQSLLAGGEAGVRVVVTDSKNQPVGGGSLRIELDSHALFAGKINLRGTAEAQFRVPAGLSGMHAMRYMVDTPIGSTEFTQQVRVEDKASILLTTEKPIYQPGQAIHVRALALDRSNHQASAGHKLTFEMEDSRGNKVFRKATQTDRFGVASAEFGLAEEVNLGTYHLRALMDGANAEIALKVERYVLPKFKIGMEFSGKHQHGYRPGDHVTGVIRANYFFGKAVDGGEVSVKASGMDVARFEAASLAGKTDHDGEYRFDLKLPDYFAGRPLDQAAARVLIEATVKDTAGHPETRGEPVTVSASPLMITAVPEGGTLIPGLENQVFVLVSYADGKPAAADVAVRAEGNADQRASTDAGGIAMVRVTGAAGMKLKIEARDKDGNHLAVSLPLEVRDGSEQVLLRTERAVYRAGDPIQLSVLSTKLRGSVYVDVVREGQTVVTRDLDIRDGRAALSLVATAEMAGTLDFNAYVFGADGRPVADHRLVFVQPAEELKIETSVDAPVYRPGGEAQVRFHVTNRHGEGVQAALGVQAVDEAVFALAEKQPGFAKVFFYLEQEAMKPRYEIHSIGMPEVVEEVPAPQLAERDRAARALFAATEMANGNRFETELGRGSAQAKLGDYLWRYRAHFVEQLRTSYGDPKLVDAWGTPVKIVPAEWDREKTHFVAQSAGPDKEFGTPDDLGVAMEMRGRRMVGKASSAASGIRLVVEPDRGAMNGLAEIVGTVVDRWGGAIEGARIEAREVSTGQRRASQARGDGEFTFSAIAAGEYELRVSTASESIVKSFALRARDRAVVSVLLSQEPERRAMVVDGPQRIRAGGRVVAMPAPPMAGFGGGGGVIGGMVQMDRAELKQFAVAGLVMESRASNSVLAKTPAAAAPHVRSYFPEALYINPEIITDEHGVAGITIPLADSITTWRMALMASTTRGALGSGVSSIKVFQDFFADIDLPVTLTEGDRVSIPVAVYNYSGDKGDVGLHLQNEAWFSLVEDAADKNLTVEAGRVGGSQFTIEAKRIGKFKLTLTAKMNNGARADVIVREIEVIPNGREQTTVFNGRLETSARHEVNFPAATIADSSRILVRLYPGPLSQVIEGMDSILRMPGGCFEQTSSSTYPNVLALAYMKRTKKLSPEVHAKAEGFIANGYQRLLTFEVPGGGFSWFGSAPANKILTAYGLMEFYDMSKVHDVDAKLIDRTQQWLAGQQQADGSWKPDVSFINEGATNRFNTDVLRITAYIAWSLENTGYRGPEVEKARRFVSNHMNAKQDSYTLAVLANFAADYGKDREFTRQAMQLLLDAGIGKDDQESWSAEETGVYGRGASASIETTGLAVQALLKWGEASGTATKALTYLASKKDASGTWGTTQATIMALQALLLSTEKGAADVRGVVEVSLNGAVAETLTLTEDNNDLLHQFVLKGTGAANSVSLRFTGKGGLAYQVAGRYFVPWTEKPANEPLSIDISYDRTHLSQDDIATATATVRNNLDKAANMVMVDLGIPPGFDLLTEDLDSFREKSAGRKGGRLEKFSLTATQAILYFDSIPARDTLKLQFRLRAKYPIRAKTFLSRVYEYYDPEVSAIARPAQFEVRKR